MLIRTCGAKVSSNLKQNLTEKDLTSDGSYLESNSHSPPIPKDRAWLRPRGNVCTKHKGSYCFIVWVFLSGNKISNCIQWTGGRDKSGRASMEATSCCWVSNTLSHVIVPAWEPVRPTEVSAYLWEARWTMVLGTRMGKTRGTHCRATVKVFYLFPRCLFSWVHMGLLWPSTWLSWI